MKKPSKLQGLFYLGLIPILIIGAFLGLILFGVFHTKSASAGINNPVLKTNIEETHVCPKPEKVVVHDTIFIECKRKHYEPKKETPVSEPQVLRTDTNSSEKQSE